MKNFQLWAIVTIFSSKDHWEGGTKEKQVLQAVRR
jgi:hypothetical protein